MTPVEFNRYIEARLEMDKRDRVQRANEVVAMIHGQRVKRPNLRKIHRDLVGEEKPQRDISRFADMLRESDARVASQQAKTNGN